MQALGYVAESPEEAVADYYPGYKEVFTKVGQERGFAAVTKTGFVTQNAGPQGVLLVGSPEDVAEKILHHNEALGGISRLTF